eukprot:Gb_03088 [translate_table: standard]
MWGWGLGEADARIQTENKLQKKCNDLICQLEVARDEQAHLQAEIEKCKGEQEEDRLKLSNVVSDLQHKEKYLEVSEKDIEQLKNLITQLDVTREELVEKLKVTMADQQLFENRITELEAEVQRLTEDEEARNTEISQLHTLVETLSTEGDHLRSEAVLTIRLQPYSFVRARRSHLSSSSFSRLPSKHFGLLEAPLGLAQGLPPVALFNDFTAINAVLLPFSVSFVGTGVLPSSNLCVCTPTVNILASLPVFEPSCRTKPRGQAKTMTIESCFIESPGNFARKKSSGMKLGGETMMDIFKALQDGRRKVSSLSIVKCRGNCWEMHGGGCCGLWCSVADNALQRRVPVLHNNAEPDHCLESIFVNGDYLVPPQIKQEELP